MAAPKGYHSYRGRTSLGKVALAVVLVLVILAAAAVVLLQRYVVYDEAGRPRLELPSAAASSQPAVSTPPDSSGEEEELNIVIEKPDASRIWQLSAAPLTLESWAAAQTQMAASSLEPNAVALTLKDSGGRLYFASGVQGVPGGVVQTAADTQQALQELVQGSEYAVARISCFLDGAAATSDIEGRGLKNTGGYIFYDGNNRQWLDPGKAGARAYLCELAVAAAKLGFQEILLTEFSYPTEGKLDKIDYGETMKSENLRLFLEELQEALADYDVTVSLELPAATVLAGNDHVAGIMLEELAPLLGRIYAETTAAEAAALQAAVTALSPETVFVPELRGETFDGPALYLPAA